MFHLMQVKLNYLSNFKEDANMPLYDYKCDQHGVFHELVAMNESGHAKHCPTCGNACGRVILLSKIYHQWIKRKKKHTK